MEGAGPGTAGPERGAAQAVSPPASPSKDIHGSVREAIFSSSPVLDLSQSGLHHLGHILQIPTLKQLHLQRNALCTIPGNFFQLLPNLTWLDLRHNQIRALPPGIGSHRYLKTLLLERNPIKMLPAELGNVTTLTALNLRQCPLEFPPQLVVQRGPAAILSFLRACAAKLSSPREPASRAISPTKKMNLSQPPHPLLNLPEECAPHGETTNSRGPRGSRLKETGDPFPPVGNLDPSELRRPPDSQADWPSEEEVQHFWMLRQEIVEKQRAQVLENQLLAMELPPNLQAMLRTREEARPSPGLILRRKTPASRGVLPDLVSAPRAVPGAGRLEERRAAALRERREKQALMEQRARDRRVLQEWREQAQTMKRRREELGKLPPPQQTLVASKIPFATDLTDHEKRPVSPPGKRGQSNEKSPQSSNARSAFPGGQLEDSLRQHTQQVHGRRRVFRGTAPLQERRRAAGDLETDGEHLLGSRWPRPPSHRHW